MSEELTSPGEQDHGYPPPPYAAALLPDDPPAIGPYWLDGRLIAHASGVSYLAHDSAGTSAMVVLLSAGASDDAGARDRLASEVAMMHSDTVLATGGTGQDGGRFADRYVSSDDYPITTDETPLAPWVALAWDGTPDAIAEADRVLHSVDLSSTPMLGNVSGPDFELPWTKRAAPGNWRSWPLNWPRNRQRAGATSLLAAWLLMLLLTALALLIVVLIFQNTPPASPINPIETPSSGTGSGSPSSPSGSPSGSGSESVSPTSGTPDAQPSWTPSMWSSEPTSTLNPGGGTQNTKL
ncbi:MAG: hypothetical protein LBJ43_01040 [Propionibacteriaceae bacterium]|jgi:hypothetical protein|nr:hypothetical protein [Propionibacteriaceae bacterium]